MEIKASWEIRKADDRKKSWEYGPGWHAKKKYIEHTTVTQQTAREMNRPATDR